MRSLVINFLLALSFFSMMVRADEIGGGDLSTANDVFAEELADIQVSTKEKGTRTPQEVTSSDDSEWASELLPPMPAWDPQGPNESLQAP